MQKGNEVGNEFLKMINVPVFNTDSTIRYSLLYQVRPETLSHHITEVGLLSYAIALKLRELGDDINIGKLLEKVLLHDLDEVLTGDIPRSTKYYSSDGLHAMRAIARDAMEQLSQQFCSNNYVLHEWESAKMEKEGFILELADMLCVSRKCITEIHLLSNAYFLKVAYEMDENLQELSKNSKAWKNDLTPESHEYIQRLISDSRIVLQEIFFKNKEKFDDYGVGMNVFQNSHERDVPDDSPTEEVVPV